MINSVTDVSLVEQILPILTILFGWLGNPSSTPTINRSIFQVLSSICHRLSLVPVGKSSTALVYLGWFLKAHFTGVRYLGMRVLSANLVATWLQLIEDKVALIRGILSSTLTDVVTVLT